VFSNAPTTGETLSTISTHKVSWWLDDITGVDKCVIRRLPQDAKLIHGVWMRELGRDEIMKASDWIDKISQHVHYPVGEPAKYFNCPVYRPLTTKGNTKN
jgi:hypothetical protein